MPRPTDGTDLLVLLLAAVGPKNELAEPVRGVTRLQKLLYLAEVEGGIPESSGFKFEPYRFGPFSRELYSGLEFLQTNGFVEASAPGRIDRFSAAELEGLGIEPDAQPPLEHRYRLTARGRRLAELLRERTDPQVVEALARVKRQYGALSLTQLIRYVYRKYPQSAVNSELTHLKP